jgi:hypothetical protein
VCFLFLNKLYYCSTQKEVNYPHIWRIILHWYANKYESTVSLHEETSIGCPENKCCIAYSDFCTLFRSEGQQSQSEVESLGSVGCPWTLPPPARLTLPAKLMRTEPSGEITSFLLYWLLFSSYTFRLFSCLYFLPGQRNLRCMWSHPASKFRRLWNRPLIDSIPSPPTDCERKRA